jgi:Ni/Fe-hydrogenase 1 B-type cytochrome subunit
VNAGPRTPPQPRQKPGWTFAKKIPPASGDYHWVYLWELPLRSMHWIAAACIVVLAVTGFYIGKPYFLTGGEASSHFLMGKVRLIHFTAAGLLVATGIVRFYWLFAGNKFERLAALFPVRPRDWVNMIRQIKFYLMVEPDKAPRYLGHNPLQQMSYTGMYAAALAVVVTGFTLYGQSTPEGFFFTVTAWVPRLLGGLQRVRFFHHVLIWAFLIFIPIHIYLAMRADVLERTGTISSIISGGRFVSSSHRYVDE